MRSMPIRCAARRALLALAAASMPACTSPDAQDRGDRPAAPPAGDPERGVSVRELGGLPASGRVDAAAYDLGRVVFTPPDAPPAALPLEVPLSAAPPEAIEELRDILARFDESRKGARAAGTRAPAVLPEPARREYQLHVTHGPVLWLLDISIFHAGGGAPECIAVLDPDEGPGGETSFRSQAPSLLAWLEQCAARSLLEDIRRPRRPLAAYDPALADLLDARALSEATLAEIRERVVRELARPDPTPALVPVSIEHAGRFEPAELSPLAGAAAIGPRLVLLTSRAADGDREALEEMLILSLEYHGDALLFLRALRVAVPPGPNPDIYPDVPAETPQRRTALDVLRTLRERVAGAEFRPGIGWVITDRAGAP